jgi:dTDP-4-dehydrorhamnose reductase
MYLKSGILITGAEGQLGQAFKNIVNRETTVFYANKSTFDITDKMQMETVFKKLKPSVLINTAAYTQVDAAQTNKELSFAINADAVKNISELCKKYNCALIHLSTDYVFDGTHTSPYKETNTTNPVTVYGKSKRAGEQTILDSGLSQFAIIRTSWLYSEFGHNFYKTMLRLAENNIELKVVNDQRGCPTNASELAKALLLVASKLSQKNSGVYHYCNGGETTWYGFARAIFEKHKLPVILQAVASNEFPTVAKRPEYSVLDSSKIKSVFDLEILEWKEALDRI